MGVLIEGVWRDEELPEETGLAGEFRRAVSGFRGRITADGSSGFKAETGRYHLYVAHGCPWAHRALIYRALKKLEGAITVAYAIPGLKEQGWTFASNPAFPDCTPADNFAVGLLCEMVGYGVPVVVVPDRKPQLASHPAFAASLQTLRGMGVRVLFDPETPYQRRLPPWREVIDALPVKAGTA